MSTITRAEMIDRVLSALGVKAAGVAASAEDSADAGSVVDSLYSRLHKRGLAPYTIADGFPDWAETPFRDMAAFEAAPLFGLGSDPALAARSAAGERELRIQLEGDKQPVPVRTRYY